VRGEVGGAHLGITGVRRCRRGELCGGGELEMVVANGGSLGRERGKEEGKPWCRESRGISRPFIWPGGVRRGGTGEEMLVVNGGNDARL
jgi:hypothetical protein